MLCPVSGMSTAKIERLIFHLEHDSFEHGMAELVSAPNSTATSNMRKLWCTGSNQELMSSYTLYNICKRNLKNIFFILRIASQNFACGAGMQNYLRYDTAKLTLLYMLTITLLYAMLTKTLMYTLTIALTIYAYYNVTMRYDLRYAFN